MGSLIRGHPHGTGWCLASYLGLHLSLYSEHSPQHDAKMMFLPGFSSTRRHPQSWSLWWVTQGLPPALPAPGVLIKFQDSQSRFIPAEPCYKAVDCQTPSIWVSPALIISEIWKLTCRFSPLQPPPPSLTLGLAGYPQHAALCRHSGPP